MAQPACIVHTALTQGGTPAAGRVLLGEVPRLGQGGGHSGGEDSVEGEVLRMHAHMGGAVSGERRS